jgi:hypothetical protein
METCAQEAIAVGAKMAHVDVGGSCDRQMPSGQKCADPVWNRDGVRITVFVDH